ncbi:MAG: serine/threonine protein kinase [Oscillospiraceae bacterium]|nr:serine/threonine protein kinase [Oscillospiraceae bacterium]
MINISGRSLCSCCFAEIFSEPCPKCGFSEASYTPELAVLPCGSVLQGRYAIGRVIGKGGFGVTYLAYDTKLERKIAIKEFFPRDIAARSADTATVAVHEENDAETFKNGAQKFYDEARLVAKFNGSSSIVNVFDFFYEDSTVYYSMEYLQGQTIKECVSKRGVMTVQQVKKIAEEVASALEATHGANVLHRDVSPDNIMLCSDGKIKLLDFGAARQVVSERSQSFSVILKPGFAPLEQYQKKGRQGPWTDIYSLGTTLYYCLTGKIPEDPMSRMENDETFASGLMSVDEGLRGIIRKATALKIEDRYGSAAELLNDLKNGFAASAQNTEVQGVQIQQCGAAVPQNAAYSAEPQQYSAEPAAETMPDVNAYGETAAASNKPLIIAAVLGAIIIVLIVFLIIFLAKGGKNDTVTADVETQSTQQSTPQNNQHYGNDVLQTNAAQTVTDPDNETIDETEKPVEMEAAETEQPSDTVKIGSEFYDINTFGTLDLTGKGLKNEDIENLKYMTMVSEIILSDNDLTDLSALSELKQLEKLTFHNNNVTDLSFLKNMKRLTVLGAGNNGISDISIFSEVSGLKEIWIFDNNISDIAPLKNCKYLEHVDVSGNSITDLTPLSGCKLIILKADYNRLNGSYDALTGLTIFDELHLEGNGYDDDPDGFYAFCYEFGSDSNGFSYWI